MRFVKPSDYFTNWGGAIEAIIEIWGEEYRHEDTVTKLLVTVTMILYCLLMCTFGLTPDE